MGDVTFLHDSNGLVLGPDEPRPDLTIVVVNDDGGSIFSMLEQGAPEHGHAFERLFGTPHGVDLAALCARHSDSALAGRQPRRARARTGLAQRRHRRASRRSSGVTTVARWTSGSARSRPDCKDSGVEITLLLVGMAVAVLVSTAVADRLDIPAPLLLVVVGAIGASYIPQVPEIHLESEVVLFGLLPPLLYAAAQNTSLVDFRANRRPILLLSVGLVAFTTAGVAVVVKLLLPDLDWALAFAIGAVVAPPDAVAATAIGRRIGLPRRITTILEGESLLNDATALVALRTALAVATGSGFDAFDVGVDFVIAAGGGALVGFVLFVVVAKVRHFFVTDPVIDGAISLVVPFVAFVAAEEIHASGVIAVVVAGLLLGHKSHADRADRRRPASPSGSTGG